MAENSIPPFSTFAMVLNFQNRSATPAPDVLRVVVAALAYIGLVSDSEPLERSPPTEQMHAP